MTDMSIREAQTQVKNLLITFRALKHFEAIIDTVASAEQRVADLADAIVRCEQLRVDAEVCRVNAQRFSEHVFMAAMRSEIGRSLVSS